MQSISTAKIRKFPLQVALAKAAVKVVRNPYELNNIKDLSFRLKDVGATKELTEFYQKGEDTKSFFEAPHTLGKIDLAQLRRLPKGTFGRASADFFDDQNLDPNALDVNVGKTADDLMMGHLYETHDLWHVVTGFKTDVAGELGLQAFYAAQSPAPLAIALISLGLMNAFLYEREDSYRRLEQVAHGWMLGKKSRNLFGINWASLWDVPLEDLRRELKVA